jgi:hypothetical protein
MSQPTIMKLSYEHYTAPVARPRSVVAAAVCPLASKRESTSFMLAPLTDGHAIAVHNCDHNERPRRDDNLYIPGGKPGRAAAAIDGAGESDGWPAAVGTATRKNSKRKR